MEGDEKERESKDRRREISLFLPLSLLPPPPFFLSPFLSLPSYLSLSLLPFFPSHRLPFPLRFLSSFPTTKGFITKLMQGFYIYVKEENIEDV